ncbi:sensor histidine kinase [Luteimonas sp. A277]
MSGTGVIARWFAPAPDSLVGCAMRQDRAAWTELVHLMWTAWVFITPAFTPGGYNSQWLALTLVSYPLFLVLFGRAVTVPERNAWRPAVAMIVLCLVLLRWYPAGMSYFVFGCVYLHVHGNRSLSATLARLSLLGAGFVGYALWLGYPWQAVVWMPLVVLIVGPLIHVERANQRKDAALKLSHEEIRRLASTAERERIGRDLHDLLGQTLSMVALKSDLAARLVERDPSSARREIEEVAAGARQALDQVRRAVSGIRAAELAGELASARLLLETDGVDFGYEFDAGGEGLALPPGVESILALTVREAVTNIQRHARAGIANVRFSVEGGDAVLLIEDDGRGGAIVPGNGLAGMRERLEGARGSLRIGPGTRGGTRLEARLPLAANVGP